MFVLKDGSGSGYQAKVNSDKQLSTFATTMTMLQYISLYKEDAYSIYCTFKQQVANTEEFMGIITYTGNKKLIINEMMFTTFDTTLTKILFCMSPIRISGGVAVTPGNLNLFSSKQLSCTTFHQAETTPFVMAFDGLTGNELALKCEQTYIFKTNDALILKPNFPLGIKVNCANANSLVRVSISCYEIDML